MRLISYLAQQVSNQVKDTSTTGSSKVKRIFSGIQPTGQIHLGNYFGAIRQWVRLQEDKKKLKKYDQTIYTIVDLHAITLPQQRDDLQNSILESAATLIACGIDPEESILFLQSHVSLHTQLAWVLNCLTTMPTLNRLPMFKEKSKSLKEIPLGLFTYPVLQAADILLYNATDVPIGEDNVQHIQLTQHLAKGFNRIYGETFAIPKARVEDGPWARLRSLRKPENKMSKSEPDPRSRISLVDSPDEIIEKIKKCVTDFTSEVTFEPEVRFGVSNLIQIHSLCTGESIEMICENVKHLDTGKYKLIVAEVLVEYLKPIRLTMNELLKDPEHLISVLNSGAQKALDLGQPIWNDVCYKVGIAPQLNWYSSTMNMKSKTVKSKS